MPHLHYLDYPANTRLQTNPCNELKFALGIYVKLRYIKGRSNAEKNCHQHPIEMGAKYMYKNKTRRPVAIEQRGSVATFYAQISLNWGRAYRGQRWKRNSKERRYNGYDDQHIA